MLDNKFMESLSPQASAIYVFFSSIVSKPLSSYKKTAIKPSLLKLSY